MKIPKPILKIIRSEVKRGKVSMYKICQATGIDKATMTRMMKGADIRTETADRLLVFFNYEIRKKEPKQ